MERRLKSKKSEFVIVHKSDKVLHKKGDIVMIYSFEGQLISEGNRSFIEIPFNVWEEAGLKGNLPARVKVNDCVFECKLVPKGKGHYYIPINKSFVGTLGGLLDVSLEFIVSLTRINYDSPYSKENPIRTIDSIKETNVVPGYCGHCCVAMLAGISLQDVQKVMGKADGSWSKIKETLDYYGICYSEKMVYPKGKDVSLPKCCIVYADGGFKLWYEGRYYGSEAAEHSQIVSYLEIVVQ